MSGIVLRGVRQHNLKNLEVLFPHGELSVITGLSGSGKSSLAFDTLYAEGQRRYVESLSTYARQFLERMPKPDLDSAENIPPAIAIEQKNPVKNSRSTVGTLTEIYDYLRLLFAKVGRVYCPDCEKEARRDTPGEVAGRILEKHGGVRVLILFPPRDEELKDPARFLDTCRRRGYVRLWADGDVFEIEEASPEKLKKADDVYIVLDRIAVKPSERTRVSASVETAFREGRGQMAVQAEGTKFARYYEDFACPDCGRIFDPPEHHLFSFNSPLGACSHCRGFGNTLEYDEKKIVPRPNLSLAKGAIEPWTKPSLREHQEELLRWARKEGIDVEKPWSDLSERDRGKILNGTKGLQGVFPFFEEAENWRYKLHIRVFLRRYQSQFPCGKCKGKRLRPEAQFIKVGAKDIAEVTALSIAEAEEFFENLSLSRMEKKASQEILRQIGGRLAFLKEVGLSYLTLSRLARTLSGGEHQRINLANQLGSALVGTLYVLDEPSIGLHARDLERLIGILRKLVEAGNTAVVVEHDPAVIRSGDRVVELGPGAGAQGGDVVYAGTVDGLLQGETSPTARYLRGEIEFPPERARSQNKGWLRIKGARENNLKNVTAQFPLENLVAVSGVSGSGKSTLVVKTLYPALDRLFGTGTDPIGRFDMIGGFEPLNGIALIDQSPIGRSSRSNPVTYMKAWDEIRKFFAELPAARYAGLKPSHFSFNTDGGRCPVCQGEGVQHIEMHFLADVDVVCEACDGRRFKEKVLAVKYRGLSVDGVLNLTVSEAKVFFPPLGGLKGKLQLLDDVGLGYLRIGQSLSTLSGGEAQRLKIAAELGRRDGKKILYVLDEPTTGLHGADVARLLSVLDRLVSQGNTAVVIEHNLDVLSRADWVLDLGPEGGDGGGRIVAQGPPAEVARVGASHTGRFLKNYFRQGKEAGA
ncbi:MAG: excinuclease ABC subunit UvrA [Bdellovibrionota bacterium]